MGRLGGAGPPSPRRGWDEEATAAPPGRGEGAARVSQVWARLPFAAFGYLSFPPPLFLLPPPAFLLRSRSSPAAWLCPAALRPPSLPFPHPSLFLKNVGSGVQPPALAASLPARAAPSPPPPAEPPALSRVPPIPRPGGAGCDPGERSLVRSCARGDLPQVRSRLGFIANFGLFLLFYRDTDRWGRAGAAVALGVHGRQGKVWGGGTKPRVGDSPSRRGGRGRWEHPAPGRRDDVCSPHVPRAGGVEICVIPVRSGCARLSGLHPIKMLLGRGAVFLGSKSSFSLVINHPSPAFLMRSACYSPAPPV